MVQRQLGIHLLQFPVFLLELTQPLDVRSLHPAVLLLPLVISRLGDLVLATNIGHRPSRFYCFQDRDDLTLTELASLHKVSFGLAILPRKPLLFNGPVFGEGYKSFSSDDVRPD